MSDDAISKTEEPWLKVTCDGDFTRWLAAHEVSLACTTYQTGKLLLLGRKPDGGLAVFERNFTRAMGLWVAGNGFWMGTQYQLWRLENVLRPGEVYHDHDRLYVPKIGITTGDLDIHDVAVEGSGRVVFVATNFNCLATTDERYSFAPLWRPPFISAMVAEDRCHLNGLAMDGGRCRYVTAVDTADVKEGWRARRRDGGVVMSLPDGEVVVSGLSMPHSPRLYRGELWVLNSGTGWLGRVVRGKFEPLAFCPGFMRGLAFVGDFAIVGFSKARAMNTFGGLELDEEMARRGLDPQCGLQVIDLRTGGTAHWVRFEGMVSELYDVAALPGVVRPMALGFRTDDILKTIALGDAATLD